MNRVALSAFADVNPISELVTLWNSVKGLSRENARDALEAAINLAGFAGNIALPDGPPLIGDTGQDCEAYVGELVAAAEADGGNVVMGKIDWQKVLAFLAKVLPLILPLIVDPKTE